MARTAGDGIEVIAVLVEAFDADVLAVLIGGLVAIFVVPIIVEHQKVHPLQYFVSLNFSNHRMQADSQFGSKLGT